MTNQQNNGSKLANFITLHAVERLLFRERERLSAPTIAGGSADLEDWGTLFAGLGLTRAGTGARYGEGRKPVWVPAFEDGGRDRD
ncbi:hypothetical protein [Azospirillum sp. TSH58]|uniref:hypothetical protein n=1 Tax=Azospirillum sp. TSH58 TaxID=664962 RepID=UPI0011B23B28|nr:hypothetical protein [Azospirillum sp. TSH58]